jgi:uncharacterized protein YceK
MSTFRFALLASVLTSTGCGTVCNLTDPPDGKRFMGTGECYPFGGVVRSGLLSFFGPPMGTVGLVSGPAEICQGNFSTGFEQFGTGLWLTGSGLVAIADVPLSLVGDVLTLPIVYARRNREPWATWWGQQSISPAPRADQGNDRGQQVPTPIVEQGGQNR